MFVYTFLISQTDQVLLQEFARTNIDWAGLNKWEAELITNMTNGLESVPDFIVQLEIIAQLLRSLISREKVVNICVQT